MYTFSAHPPTRHRHSDYNGLGFTCILYMYTFYYNICIMYMSVHFVRHRFCFSVQ